MDIANLKDDDKFVKMCVMVNDFVVEPNKVFELAKEITKAYPSEFQLESMVRHYELGNLSDVEFMRCMRSVCGENVEKTASVKRKEKRLAKKKMKKRGKVKEDIKVVCELSGDVYHNNKKLFHNLAPKYGLKSKGGWIKEISAATLYHEGDMDRMRGVFVRDGDKTVKATLTWWGRERTPYVKDFVKICKELGGKLDDEDLRHRAGQSKLL